MEPESAGRAQGALSSESRAQGALSSESRAPLITARARRALVIIALSILVIGVAGISYLQPRVSLSTPSSPPNAGAAAAQLKLTAVDFATPTAGWVLMEGLSHDFVVFHTANGGEAWSKQLAGPAGEVGEYLAFFDSSHGMVAVLGPAASIYRTGDGGKTWGREPMDLAGGNLVSAAFVDPKHGWLLARIDDPGGAQSQELFRTTDGVDWSSLGNPVLPADVAYTVNFESLSVGWLYSRSNGPYAYTTRDGGTTWTRVTLPSPAGGWPVAPAGAKLPEVYFVAAQPTRGDGVFATVVPIAPPQGRSSAGGVLAAYPPLTVKRFDGGQPVTYIYSTSGDTAPSRYSAIGAAAKPGPIITQAADSQVLLASVDRGASWSFISPPLDGGAVAYLDAHNWWWIGQGSWSKSADGGHTWSGARSLAVPEPLPGSLQLLDADHAWFGAMAGERPLLESTDDGGIHWNMSLLPFDA
jgi:photosystem II stability/assembly factor-like uncharacterized protein